ncbi:MAG: FAD:protein FMN transferase, partial [Anaerolineales bacterium]
VAMMNANLRMTEVHTDWPERKEMGVDLETHSICLPAGTRLDLGGIAKGWAADRALERLVELGPALVDAGGDIALSPRSALDACWPVAVTDPHHPQDTIALLALHAGAVATSGREIHRWQQGDHMRHHIIDPRTGEPAGSDVLTATVIAPTAVEAEMAAKCALILGGQQGLTWLDERPDYAGLLVLEDGSQLYSRTMESYLWSE